MSLTSGIGANGSGPGVGGAGGAISVGGYANAAVSLSITAGSGGTGFTSAGLGGSVTTSAVLNAPSVTILSGIGGAGIAGSIGAVVSRRSDSFCLTHRHGRNLRAVRDTQPSVARRKLAINQAAI